MTCQSRLQWRVTSAYQSIEGVSVVVESDVELYNEDWEEQVHCSCNDASVQIIYELNHEGGLACSGIAERPSLSLAVAGKTCPLY